MDEKILIIDDDKYINDMLSEALNEEEYKVLKAYSGISAYVKNSKWSPLWITTCIFVCAPWARSNG